MCGPVHAESSNCASIPTTTARSASIRMQPVLSSASNNTFKPAVAQELALLGIATYRRITCVRDALAELVKPGFFGCLYDEEKAKAAASLTRLSGHLQALEDKVRTACIVIGTISCACHASST